MRAGMIGAANIICGMLLASEPAAAQADAAARGQADVALVLAVDVSSSVDETRFALQREGIARSLESRAVVDAILGGPHQTIELAILEWSEDQKVLVDWTVIRGPADLDAVVRALRREMRPGVGWKTDLGGAIVKATALLDGAPVVAARKVIDVSGDGQQNCGYVSAEQARSAALAKEITINGLPITSGAEPEVDHWYEGHVIGGESAFMIVANGHEGFADAMRKKLALEIAGLTPRTRLAVSRENDAIPPDVPTPLD